MARLTTIAIGVLVIVTISTGCLEADLRSCRGFGHPLADRWSTVLEEGDVATYVGSDGDTIELVLASRSDDGPDESFACQVESRRVYAVRGSDVRVSINLFHVDWWEGDPDEQRLTVRTFVTSGSTPTGPSFLIDAHSATDLSAPLVSPRQNGISDQQRLLDLEAGGQRYPIAVEERLLDDESAVDAGADGDHPLATMVAVVFAEGGGLVRFETLSGQVYQRVDPARTT